MGHDEGARASAVEEAGVDTTVPESARVYDFLLGGKDNFAADRAVGEALIEHVPALPRMVRAQRQFLSRAVEFLTEEAGIRQFLDIGSGIPFANNIHEVAQRIAPETRVMYADNDPIVIAHARAVMTAQSEGVTEIMQADLREPEAILADPTLRETLDLNEPVALMLIGILMHLRDEEEPYRLVATLMDALPSGSYLALTHPSADFNQEGMNALAASAQQSGIPYVPRSRAEVERFCAGLKLVEPGVVPILGWRPAHPPEDINSVYGWASVARKP
ncbi:MAG: SAM-dependent methyltransferase [Actinomycetota bacterium]